MYNLAGVGSAVGCILGSGLLLSEILAVFCITGLVFGSIFHCGTRLIYMWPVLAQILAGPYATELLLCQIKAALF